MREREAWGSWAVACGQKAETRESQAVQRLHNPLAASDSDVRELHNPRYRERSQCAQCGVTQLESLSSVYDRELARSLYALRGALSYYIIYHNTQTPPR